MVENSENTSIWNFDEERMKDLHFHMVMCEEGFEEWNLNLINKKLQLIELIISGANWKEGEWEEIEKDFSELEKLKREIDNIDDESIGEVKIEFYNLGRKVYKKLNKKMQDKGFFFRIREDEGL